MKTYHITREDCRDIGWAYEIDGAEYDGNLIIDVDKIIVIKGNQRVEGYQIVKGDQIVEGKAIVGHCKWVVFYYGNGNVKIGCKTKAVKEWEDWFLSSSEYETPRNSLAFKQIFKTFKMACVGIELDEGLRRDE